MSWLDNSSIQLTTGDTLEGHQHFVIERIGAYVQSDIHIYLAFGGCLVGILMNAFNLKILTHQTMRNPMNLLLGSIAVADLITMLMYAVQLVGSRASSAISDSLPFAYYKLVYIHISMIFHTISIWLTVALCLFRCLIILTQNGKEYSGYLHTIVAIILVTVLATIFAIPNFLIMKVHTEYDVKGNLGDYNSSQNQTMREGSATEPTQIWFINIGKQNATEDEGNRAERLYNAQLWIVAILLKIVPCFLLAVMSVMIIRKLWKIQSQYKTIIHTSPRQPRNSRARCNTAESAEFCLTDRKQRVKTVTQLEIQPKLSSSRNRKTNRTTLMLLVVVITFFIAEFPIALLLLLSQVMGQEFFDHIYLEVAGISDLLVIVNGSANFLIYLVMSEQFRSTFLKVFCSKRFASILKKGRHGETIASHNEATEEVKFRQSVKINDMEERVNQNDDQMCSEMLELQSSPR